MEIERKYLIHRLPEDYASYPVQQIEQGYLCTRPVVRIRRQDGEYYLTYKSDGLMVRGDTEFPCKITSPLSWMSLKAPWRP